MDRDVAKMILSATYRGGGELAHLVPFIKEHCTKDDYERISMAIAAVLHEVDSTIRRSIYQEHPDLEREIQDRVERFGRTF